MWFLGTNDQPGDYRSSGCAGCHVVYANDRDPQHSGPYARVRPRRARRQPPTRPSRKDEPGHPIKHAFTRAIPSSQCMVCHMHQPNVFVNSFLGYTMWDYESDAPLMWPEKQRYPTDRRGARDPRSQSRGRGDRAATGATPNSCSDVSTLNPQAQGHAVRRLPRPRLEFPRGLQARPQGQPARQGRQRRSPTTIRRQVQESRAPDVDPRRPRACSASIATSRRTAHGNGHIYGEVAAAIEIDCADCHGTADALSDAVHQRSGGAARRHRHVAVAHPGRPRPLRVARRQAVPALGARPGPGMGDVAGQGHASTRPARTTTRRRRAPS